MAHSDFDSVTIDLGGSVIVRSITLRASGVASFAQLWNADYSCEAPHLRPVSFGVTLSRVGFPSEAWVLWEQAADGAFTINEVMSHAPEDSSLFQSGTGKLYLSVNGWAGLYESICQNGGSAACGICDGGALVFDGPPVVAFEFDRIVPNRSEAWGAVKALYR